APPRRAETDAGSGRAPEDGIGCAPGGGPPRPALRAEGPQWETTLSGRARGVCRLQAAFHVDHPHSLEERLVDTAVINGDALFDADPDDFGSVDPELTGELFGREVVRHGSRLLARCTRALQRQSPPGYAVVGSAGQVAASEAVTIGRYSLPCRECSVARGCRQGQEG